MADEAPKTELQPPSLRIGHAIVPGQSTLRSLAMRQRPSSRRAHPRSPTPSVGGTAEWL